MRSFGTTAGRVVFAILVTALIPLAAALLVSRAIINRATSAAFQPEFGANLEQALGVYADLAKAVKQGMRAEAEAIAASEPLRLAAASKARAAASAELARAFGAHPSLVSLRVESCAGEPLAAHDRGRPEDPSAERTLEVRRALAPEGDLLECADGGDGRPMILVATFATPRARFDEHASLATFTREWRELSVNHPRYVTRTYGNAFAALLAITVILAIAAGVLVARPVTRRIAQLAAATRPVAEGDLSVRVNLAGRDEMADLGRAFNRMLEELEKSRARVEFLRRMSEWQKVARRLAHEIKNPLTPIQLAVEECHRRYRGDDAEYRRILQTTLEVVEEEVGSLRRLVGEFSSFARLPRAELTPGDLGEFLREQRDRFAHAEGAPEGEPDAAPDQALFAGVDLAFDLPDAPMPAVLDGEMLHRVLSNVIRNAAQAIQGARGASGPRGRVRVSARAEDSRYVVCVDDDGPGVPPDLREILFDPYVTTKRDGVGLGLSIVKKIVVDHGGTIEAGASPLGGARFRVTLPAAGTAEARAALERVAEPEPSAPRSAGVSPSWRGP
jgi:two-component system nitrogen regulation sensor histidine kinase NtrY